MKSQISKIGFCSIAVFCVALAAAFTACDDEIATEVTEQAGMDILAKGEKLPECSKDNVGDMVYVTDSASVFYCGDGKWTSLNGEDGKSGTPIKGKNGNSCSAIRDKKNENVAITCETDDGKGATYTVRNGADGNFCSVTQNEANAETIITCKLADGENVSYVVKNGENCSTNTNEDGSYTIQCAGSEDVTVRNGKSAYELDESDLPLEEWLKSLDGEPGVGCTAEDVKDEQGNIVGYSIYCGKKEIGTISNGINGTNGENCKIDESRGNGIVDVTCGVDDDEKTVTLYKGMCGTSSYDPKEKACYQGELYDLGSSIYDERHKKIIDLRDYQEYGVAIVEAYEQIDGEEVDPATHKRIKVNGKLLYRGTWTAQNMNYNTNTSEETSSWCGGRWGSSEGDCSIYGRLYTWEAAKEACPKGWHLPSKDEWNTMFEAIGGSAIACVKLKSRHSNGDDFFGFAALPAGIISDDIGQRGKEIWFWSSTEGIINAYGFQLFYDSYGVNEDKILKGNGLAVRCLKD